MAVKLAHEMMPGAKVGCMILAMPTYPLTPKPEDVLAAMKAEQKNYFSRMCRSAGTIQSIWTAIWRQRA